MADKRKGRQTPTESFALPYSETLGLEAAKLYNTTGKTAQEWQELILCDMMAVNEEGLWTHTKYGYSVPRRNGKNEVVVMRELYGLTNGEDIAHTAHRTSTSHSAWERLCEALAETGLEEGKDYKTVKQFGLERIIMKGKGGGRISFRTRSSKGGLGEGFDLLVIDEAQEYTDDQESALKYVVTSSKNPQTIFCGTPPTVVSSGTVFQKFRESILAGEAKNSGWAEWSVESMTDPNDEEAWYRTNPSLGTVFTKRSVADEIGPDTVDFNVQRLGLWIRYNLKSAITEKEWNALEVPKLPKLVGDIYAAVKFSRDSTTVSLSVAVKTSGKKVFVESVDCRSARDGGAWLISYLRDMEPRKIVVDGANGSQKILADGLKIAKVRNVILPAVSEVIVANSLFEQGVFGGEICHAGQPSLAQSVSNTEHRAIGSSGGFGYRTIKDAVDVTLVESVALAYWACHEDKPRRKQKISY